MTCSCVKEFGNYAGCPKLEGCPPLQEHHEKSIAQLFFKLHDLVDVMRIRVVNKDDQRVMYDIDHYLNELEGEVLMVENDLLDCQEALEE